MADRRKVEDLLKKNYPLFNIRNWKNQPDLDANSGAHLESVNRMIGSYHQLIQDPKNYKLVISYLESIGDDRLPEQIHNVTMIRKIFKNLKLTESQQINGHRMFNAQYSATKDVNPNNLIGAFYAAEYGIVAIINPPQEVPISWENFNRINQAQNVKFESRQASEAPVIPEQSANLTPEQLQLLGEETIALHLKPKVKQGNTARETALARKHKLQSNDEVCKFQSIKKKPLTKKFVKDNLKKYDDSYSISADVLKILTELGDPQYVIKLLGFANQQMSQYKTKKKRLTMKILHSAYKQMDIIN